MCSALARYVKIDGRFKAETEKYLESDYNNVYHSVPIGAVFDCNRLITLLLSISLLLDVDRGHYVILINH